jgi:hypothetical protein
MGTTIGPGKKEPHMTHLERSEIAYQINSAIGSEHHDAFTVALALEAFEDQGLPITVAEFIAAEIARIRSV